MLSDNNLFFEGQIDYYCTLTINVFHSGVESSGQWSPCDLMAVVTPVYLCH